MAAERSFDPTPRRLEEARRRGEVAFSRDLTSAAAMAAAIVALVMQGPALTARLFGYFREAFAAAPAAGGATAALATGMGVLARSLAAPLLAALVLALAAGALQTRGLLALGALRADLARLSPAAGLRRVFGGQAAWQVGKGLVKVAIVAALAWITVRPVLGGVLALAGDAAAAHGERARPAGRAAGGTGGGRGAGAGRGRLPVDAAAAPAGAADDARRGEAGTQGVGGGPQPPGRAAAAAPGAGGATDAGRRPKSGLRRGQSRSYRGRASLRPRR